METISALFLDAMIFERRIKRSKSCDSCVLIGEIFKVFYVEKFTVIFYVVYSLVLYFIDGTIIVTIPGVITRSADTKLVLENMALIRRKFIVKSIGSRRFTNYASSQAEEDSFDLGSIRTGKRSGIVASVANLAKGALGGGVLSGHVAYMKSGFMSAILLNFGFGFYLATCFYLLVKSAQILCKRCHVGYMTYPDLAEAALSLSKNPKINRMAICYKHFIEFIICLNLYGSCACYQLIIAKTIKQLCENTDRSDVAGLDGMPNLRVYVAIMIIPVIMITLITELKYLAPFSILANAFVGFCVLMAIYYARVNNPNFENMSAFNGLYNQVIYTGMAVFSMSSAGVVLPVENNMANPKKIGFVLFVGYIFIIGSVFLCSFFGYVGYLENCRSPITMNFPMTLFPMILKGCIAAMIYVTHALNFYMPFNTCFVYLKKFHKEEQWFKWELIYRALISLIISIVAIIFPSIDALMGFLGCFCLSNMAFIGPNFIYMVVVWDRPGLGKFKWRLVRAVIFVIIGICILVCGTIVASFEMVATFVSSTSSDSSGPDTVMLVQSAAETALETAAATVAATVAATKTVTTATTASTYTNTPLF